MRLQFSCDRCQLGFGVSSFASLFLSSAFPMTKPRESNLPGFELHLLVQAQIRIYQYKSMEPPGHQEIASFSKMSRKSGCPVLNLRVQGGIFPLAAKVQFKKSLRFGGTANPNPVIGQLKPS